MLYFFFLHTDQSDFQSFSRNLQTIEFLRKQEFGAVPIVLANSSKQYNVSFHQTLPMIPITIPIIAIGIPCICWYHLYDIFIISNFAISLPSLARIARYFARAK